MTTGTQLTAIAVRRTALRPVVSQPFRGKAPQEIRVARPRPDPRRLWVAGILGIVVASLGLVGMVAIAAYDSACYDANKNAADVVRDTAVRDGGNSSAIYGIVTSYDGLWPYDRYIAIRTLAAAAPLDRDQRRQLQALLARDGTEIIANDIEGLTPAEVRYALRSADVIEESPGAAGRCTRYVTLSGIVRVYRDHAVFQPANDPSVRVVASDQNGDEPAPDNSSWPESDYRPLTDAEVGAMARQLEKIAGKKLSNEQKLNVCRMLHNPGQHLIPQSAVLSPFKDVVAEPWGGFCAEFPNGMAMIRKDGTVEVSTHNLPHVTQPLVQVSVASCRFLALSCVSGAALYALLLMAGILLITTPRRGIGPALIYALLAIPFAFVIATALGSVMSQYEVSSLPLGSPASAAVVARRGAWAVAAFVGIVAAIYPIYLLIILPRFTGRRFEKWRLA